MFDPYEGGIPKYSTAWSIYDALCELVQTEEMGILSEIGVDVSWENQGYYYTDKGYILKEKFDELSDCGNKMYLIELAITQLDHDEIHGTIYEVLQNPDLAKRIGFRKMFVEDMLRGDGKEYKKIVEEYADLLNEEDRCDQYTMIGVWDKLMKNNGTPLSGGVTPYPAFARRVSDKVSKLDLGDETRLVAGCRAHLTAYDDFIFGLKANQALHERQEQLYAQRVIELREEFKEQARMLMAAAERAGLLPALIRELEAQGLAHAALPVGVETV